MKTSFKYHLFLMLLVALSSCTNEEELLKLTISNISPGTTILGGSTLNTAMKGDTMAITGTNFSDIANENTVFVHGVPSQVITATNSLITARIPDDVPYSVVEVLVKRQGYQDAIKSISIRDSPSPVINAIKPTSGPIGSIVTIYGKNLLETVEANMVAFSDENGKPVVIITPFEPIFASSDSLQVQIPAGTGTGAINLYAKPVQNIDNGFFGIITPVFTITP